MNSESSTGRRPVRTCLGEYLNFNYTITTVIIPHRTHPCLWLHLNIGKSRNSWKIVTHGSRINMIPSIKH